MKKIFVALFIFINILSCNALANKISKIVLNDGSVIVGEISEINNGVYTVNSQEMGKLQIEESRIKQIGYADGGENLGSTQFQTNELKNKTDELRGKMMSDKQTLGMIMSLQNDPQFQEILKDPEIMNAIKSGNTAALMNNEKFMRLKDNSTIQEIGKRTSQ